ncbi:MAG TPA: glycine--tRNA ligase [Candidatus Eisenbacteria bacterium]|nr:glycine--tRNA ligase [Candidatus Eisenbacteria bacterium]
MSAKEVAEKMDKIVALSKRRGFLFPGSEIYGGIGSTYDYGPLGSLLKKNVREAWWKAMVQSRDDMVGLDAAIIMHPKTWEASGHLAGFTDPLVDCKSCKKRFRADHLLEAKSAEMSGLREKPVEMSEVRCPSCGGELTDIRNFNLMFKTTMGPLEDAASVVYLRPETAQGIFVNFGNVRDTARKRIPFGIAQTGKSFRNEITPGNFIFRTREFEQMEMEYFVKPGTDEETFEYWKQFMMDWFVGLGLKQDHLRFYEHPKEKLSHYSKRTVDLEYAFPWGWGELWGCANRTDFDLKQHAKFSGQDLSYRDDLTNEKYVPFVIEPALGLDRAVLTFMLDAYEEIEGGRTTTTEAATEVETVLRFHPAIAPIKAAIFPLSKKEPLASTARALREKLARRWMVQYDDAGSVGRRYRRQDEIGTPFCITVDFETETDKKVTVRDRDTMQQERIALDEVESYLAEKLGC